MSKNVSIHRVRLNDQIYRIMRDHYGAAAFLQDRAELTRVLLENNPHISDPDLIFPGQIVVLPPLANASTAPEPVSETVSSANSQLVTCLKRADPATIDLMSLFAPEKVGAIAVNKLGNGYVKWVDEAASAAVHDARSVARNYLSYKSGQLTRGQYNYRRQVDIRSMDVKLKGLRSLITPGKTSSEVLRADPNASNRIYKHIKEIDRFDRIVRTARRGLVVLKAIDIADTANKIHHAKDNKERTVVVLDSVASSAGTAGAVALTAFLVGTPTGWVALAGMAAVGIAGSLAGEAIGKAVQQEALYDERGNREQALIDRIWDPFYD